MSARGLESSAVASTAAGVVCSIAALAAIIGASAGRAESFVSTDRISAAAVLRAEYADRQFDTTIASLAVAAPTVAEFQQISAIRAIEIRTGRLPESEQAIQAALARAMKLGATAPTSNSLAAGAAVIVAVNLTSILFVTLALSARRRERARIVARLDMPAESVSTGDFANAFFLCLVQKGLSAAAHGVSSPRTGLRLPAMPEFFDSRQPQSPTTAAPRTTLDDHNDGIGPTGVRANQ